MTKARKTRFLKFLRGLSEGCDKYSAKNEKEWQLETAMRRQRNKLKKAHAKRLESISQGTGYAKRKTKKA